MSVYARTDTKGRKTYWFRFTIQGKQIKRSTHQADKEVAKRLEAEFRSKYMAGGIEAAEPTPPDTLAKFAPRFLDFCDRKGIKPSTRAWYVRTLNTLAKSKTLKALPLSEIRAAVFEEYVAERIQSPNQKGQYTTILGERQVLMSVLRYAYSLDMIESVPLFFVVGRKVQRRRDYVPDEASFTKYIQAAGPVLRDAAILSASTGMRPREILALSLPEIAPVHDGYVICLLDSKSEMGKKPIHLSKSNAEPACAVIQQRSAKAVEGRLFHEWNGSLDKRVKLLSQAHDRLRKKLALDSRFVFYSFRHLYVTVAGKGLQPQELRELARHQDIRTTMHYFNPDEARRREVASNVKLPLLSPGDPSDADAPDA